MGKYRPVKTPYLHSKFIEITLWLASSPVNFLHISTIPIHKNTSGRLLEN